MLTRDDRIMTDAEVASLFGIATKTLQRRVKKPQAGEINLNDAKPQIVGGRRFWVRSRVEALAGLKERTK